MKKVLGLIMAIVMIMGCVFALTACNDTAEPVVKVIDVDLSNEQYAFAVKKGNTELLNSVNAFFEAKKDEIAAIFDKYTAKDAALDTFGKDTIKTEPTGAANELVVATNLDFSPFEYLNGNKIAGIDMEIAELLATYLNKELVIVNMDFNAVVTSVETLDTYDIGIAGLTITDERKEQVDFSVPYFGATQAIVTKIDDTTFDGLDTAEKVEAKLKELTGDAAKCGGQSGTTSQYYIQGNADMELEGFENLTFSHYKSAALAIKDMLNGKIAFVVVDKTTAGALVNSFNK